MAFISFYLYTAHQFNCHAISSQLMIVSIQYTYGLIPVQLCGNTMSVCSNTRQMKSPQGINLIGYYLISMVFLT